jgi:hypothetical protein
MKNDQTTNERKVSDMKKISFEPQFTATFNEQTLWYQQDNANKDDEKLNSAPTLPDLFENHRNQQEKNSTESNFEQLCSLRANDNGSGLFPFQSSSTIRDEVISNDDVFWQNHPIYLVNSTENKPRQQSASSSSEGNSDEDELKIDSNIPDDEKFFMETQESVQPNNMMDIFRRQSSNPNETNNEGKTQEKPAPIVSDDRKVLNLVEQNNGEMNSDDDDLSLQNNFSFLIAKGMLKPS